MLHRGYLLKLVIINIVDTIKIAALKFENDSPIARDFYSTIIFIFTDERMKVRPGIIHVFYVFGRIQSIQYKTQFVRVFWLYALFCSMVEKIFQSFVRETFNQVE